MLLCILGWGREALAAKLKFPTTAGAPVGPVFDRPSLPFRSCGPSVCVHAATEALTPARRAFDDAWDLLVDTLRVTPPLLDGPAGGDPRLDVYVVRGLEDEIAIGREPLDRTLDRDGAPAFVLIREEVVLRGGCALTWNAARALARASAAGVDVAETPTMVDGFARRLADLACPVAPPMHELQRTPWKGLTTSGAGAALLARTLDLEYGHGYGAIGPAVLSMAINHRGVIVPQPDDELGPAHFHNHTTVFDVLTTTLTDAASSLDKVLLDVGAARATHAVPPAWEWEIPASTLPRRFAIRRGIEPMGMTFVKIDVDAAPPGDGIELDLAWDMGARFVWHVLKLDAEGKRVGEVPVPALDTERKITIDVRRLSGVRTLVLVGVNTGDPRSPFHPDEPPSHAHGYELGVFPGS